MANAMVAFDETPQPAAKIVVLSLFAVRVMSRLAEVDYSRNEKWTEPGLLWGVGLYRARGPLNGGSQSQGPDGVGAHRARGLARCGLPEPEAGQGVGLYRARARVGCGLIQS